MRELSELSKSPRCATTRSAYHIFSTKKLDWENSTWLDLPYLKSRLSEEDCTAVIVPERHYDTYSSLTDMPYSIKVFV